MHDIRKKDPVAILQSTYQITAVSFDDTAEQVFGGGIDNDIKVSRIFFFSPLYLMPERARLKHNYCLEICRTVLRRVLWSRGDILCMERKYLNT